ncbi:MAG: YlbL family protein [Rhodoglobus sp.]
MALFTDTAPDPVPYRRHSRLGWTILGLGFAGLIVVALIPAPFVIEEPGPVYNTLGTVSIGGDQVPMIQIPDEKTYPTEGSLSMLTVSVRGSRDELPNWFEVGSAYFDSSRAVLPVDAVYSPKISQEDSDKQARVDMDNSQKEAISAALSELGYSFSSTVTVVETSPNLPADGVLQAGDVLLSVDGSTFTDVTGLRAEIAAHGVDRPAVVELLRDGQKKKVTVTPVLSKGDDPAPIIGVTVGSDYDFPLEVSIQLENVGGPSAGMMFALGIIDKLSPGQLNGGENVAGTGTISGTGEVGPIGGIRQKMYGARGAGAEWFLAPESNCDEVTGHIPAGLTVFAVADLDDAMAAMAVVAAGDTTSGLPTCPTR